MNDFRKDFKNFDDACLVNIEEYGQLMGVSPAGMAMKRHAGELAEPCMQGGKLLRWRCGDLRAWFTALNQDRRPDPAQGAGKRLGRPRLKRTEEIQHA
jgi:hypothetical protein